MGKTELVMIPLPSADGPSRPPQQQGVFPTHQLKDVITAMGNN